MHYSEIINEMDLSEKLDNFIYNLDKKEKDVIDSLCKNTELTHLQLFRQMLRLYQSVNDGFVTVEPNRNIPKLKNFSICEKTITLHGYPIMENEERIVFKDQKVYCQIVLGKDVYFEIKDDKAYLIDRKRATELGWGNYAEM